MADATARKSVVLYVDDDVSNRLVFEHSFNDEFDIILAEDALSALAVLADRPVEIIVTDQRMPGKSGMDLLETVKSTHPRMIRMVVTAYADLEPILRAVNEGLVARYFMKPWDYHELRGALNWGVEVFRAAEDDNVLAARILQTERMTTLGTIAASLVHDLRQPLSYMRYNVDRLNQLKPATSAMRKLLESPPSTVPSDELKALESLSSEFEDLVTDMSSGTLLISDLLKNLASWISPTRSQVSRTADAVQVIRFAGSICQSITRGARAHVTYEGPDRLENVAIEPAELTQILVNLISNAAQAIEATGRPGEVAVKAVVERLQLTVSVRDDGPGMPPEMVKKLGTLFFSTRKGGTGLGFNQCLRLVSRAGGDLRVESAEGKGTTVFLHLRKVFDG